MIRVQIDDNHKNALALIEYLQSLDFVKLELDQEVNSWQKEKLDELYDAKQKGELKLIKWEDAKNELSLKFKVQVNFEITISDYAVAQINKAADWFENEKTGLGTLFIKAINESLEFISKNPYASQKRYKDFRINFLITFSLGVHYLVEEDKIIIMAVFHTSQSDDNWFKMY